LICSESESDDDEGASMAKRRALEKAISSSQYDGQRPSKKSYLVDGRYEFEFLLYKFSCNCCFVVRVNQMTMNELSWH